MRKYKFLTGADARELELQVNQLAEHGWVVVQMSASMTLFGHKLIVALLEKEK